ncbi:MULTISPECIES: methionyl-tRNA formyltransferase [Halomonas]|uniref:methionyl-tRNA formyltransferase n=1 Tax=Halomonas TaxID=2745 RepID=UPI001C946986|nr:MULTISPECIES: methionyl-tRNA formyltransferase [Halomonas]MBY5929491.1 methionyl-tRNA formyltransferase [Halomonas sp. DP8Y7-3]MBY5968734.1 methionyl-tRNA formyltransferase [Halomonas denitrificans]MBY6028530.1 methionyl-tRNA formyltransferase [Halomonas sp. DP8Y7-1]
MTQALRVIFAGTPDFAAESLSAVLDSHHQVIAVYTQPDRPAGRGRKLTPSPVKSLALSHDIPVYQPERLKDAEEQQALAALEADVMVVVAYGLILPLPVLEAPRLGCLNVHASLLPRWRGAAPIQRAIEAGDSESGVTIMQMDEGLDTGDMLMIRRTEISNTTTGGELHDRLASLGGKAIVDALDQLAAGELTPTPQPDSGVTYAAKLSKAEAELDFRQDAQTLAARVRAFNPWPVTWCALGDDRLRIHLADAVDSADAATPGTIVKAEGELLVACGQDGRERLRITHAQLPGGKALPINELLRARAERFAVGACLGQPQTEASE